MTLTHIEVAAVIIGFLALMGGFVGVVMFILGRDMPAGFLDPDESPEDPTAKPPIDKERR